MKLYQSQIDFQDVGVSVLVNDLPVFTDNGSGQSSGGTVLNPYLLETPNPIHVVLTPLKGAALPPARAKVDVKVLAYTQGADGKPGPIETAYHFHWKQTEPPQRAPAPASGTLPAVILPRPLNWQDAPRVQEVDAAAKAEINAQIKSFHDALEAKNLAQIRSLLATKTDNFALALGRTGPQMDASQQGFFADDFRDPNWRMKPIAYDHLQYHLRAGGRVVQVLNPDGSDPIASVPDRNASSTLIDSYLSRLNGHWVFVL